MKFLIDGYTIDESVFTVHIQSKVKYYFKRVPVIYTTMWHIGSYMDLANLCTMQQAIKCSIELLFTIYIHLDTTPVAFFPNLNAARAN
jgi:hypothetical protein